MLFQELQQYLLTYSLFIPRLLGCFTTLPILSKKLLGGTLLRNGILFSLIFFLIPTIDTQLIINISGNEYILLIIKEILLGFFFGFIAAIPFWMMQSIGFMIDNQRGTTMASIVNPLFDEQTSPMGLFFSQAFTTLFFISGNFLFLVQTLYHSFSVWPIYHFLPGFNQQLFIFFIQQFKLMLDNFLLLAAPLVIAMFIVEWGLALISRFAPSLNVFILSMPLKGAISSLLLVSYFSVLIFNAEMIQNQINKSFKILIQMMS
ncbi:MULTISPECIES: type III secretion system export apparatus subunit SctT [Arsenophonus]|jgi:type III secretion protein T|uniref:type III secretion system export apparatus subunit SctT n=1 Tax=Arsenophonus TaxID=637 RepID=UPI0015D784DA|nr:MULTISPECIES: type III secretion system export apparatus subunit SctT [Arsenophonus]UBX28398.1 type III secretion system export apparatus subunit SctT [Arsenophonus apicola]